MTRVWPIAELDGRDILAEWTLTHRSEGHMLIRLWDGNADVHIYIDDDPRKLGGHPNTADAYPNGYHQVVSEILPGLQAEGWTVTEADVAAGIDADDADFGTDQCPRCGFGRPWWNRSYETCTVCDTAFYLAWLPDRLEHEVHSGQTDAAAKTAEELAAAVQAARTLLAGIAPDEQPEDITTLIEPAATAHRQVMARLDAVRTYPDLSAAAHLAAGAVVAAVAHGTDVAAWLAGVLATAAATLGSTDALTANRPGSWEADLVHRLVAGTVGWDDEYLADHADAEQDTNNGDEGRNQNGGA